MRKATSAGLFILFVGFVIACGFISKDPTDPSSPLAAPISPNLMLYAGDLTRSWSVRNGVRTWRTEVDDVQEDQSVHTVTEAVCPDRYHVVVIGATRSEQIYLGSVLYLRDGSHTWKRTTSRTTYQGLPFCRQLAAEPADTKRVLTVAEELRDISLSNPEIKEIAGRRCREWTRTFVRGNEKVMSYNCFELTTGELVQSKIGDTVSTYYWNIPLEIKPPI